VIEYDFWTTPTNSPVETVFPWLWNSAIFQKFRDWVKNEQFAKFMNYVLIVNLVLVIVESAYDMYKKPETPLMENLELCFSCVYVMEVGLQLCVYDFRYYWSDRSNQLTLQRLGFFLHPQCLMTWRAPMAWATSRDT